MTTGMTITLIVIVVASIALNAAQWMERKYERKECNQFIEKGARLEQELKELTKAFENEKLHRQWAVGRTKDQTATIHALEDMLRATNKDWYRRYKNEQRQKGGEQ